MRLWNGSLHFFITMRQRKWFMLAETQKGTKQRLALFDPITGDRVRWEGPIFREGTEGESQARIAILEFNRLTADDPEVTLCLGAFTWAG
jgi:hypothetical protein